MLKRIVWFGKVEQPGYAPHLSRSIYSFGVDLCRQELRTLSPRFSRG